MNFFRKKTKTETNVEKYGLEVMGVFGTDYFPTFSYTIGLTKTYNHPEIICFSLSIETAHIILNDVAKIIKAGNKIEIGIDYTNLFVKSSSQFIAVDESNLDEYFGQAFKYYQNKKFNAIQLVWTDTKNKLPWETGFEERFNFKQPLLDRNMDFKFLEEKNLGVFTTKQFLEFNQPILEVIHDEDGDWQFLTGDQMLDDCQLVCLESMVKLDPTLNETFNLDYSESAIRNNIGEKWKIKK